MLNTAVARREITPLESDGQAPFAWVALDLCVIGIGAAGALARDAAALSAIAGLTGERLLVERTAKALVEARDRARACTIEVREARGSLGVNRRNPRLPVDPRILILSLVGEDGRLQGALFHYSCHLTVLGVDNSLVSADWVCPVRRSLEAELGVPVAYLQGAEGNIDPLTRGLLGMSDPDQALGSSFDVLAELAEGVCSSVRVGLRSAPCPPRQCAQESRHGRASSPSSSAPRSKSSSRRPSTGSVGWRIASPCCQGSREDGWATCLTV